MIKVLDKVICIKTVLCFYKTKVLLEKGQIYTAKMYGLEDSSYGVEFYNDDNRVYFPYSSPHNEIRYSEIKKCIIPLAELREQQIKSILDD
jgi:hypothetical protein